MSRQTRKLVHIRSAFTLIELLVVIAIIAVLIALLCRPCSRLAKRRAVRVINNLKQIGLAMLNFENSRQVLPPTWAISTALLMPPYSTGGPDESGDRRPGPYEPPCPIQVGEVCNNMIDVQTWVTICLPFFEQGSIYNAYNIAQPYTAPVNTTFVGTQLNMMICPSAPNGYRTAAYTDGPLRLVRKELVGHARRGRLCGRRRRGFWLDGCEQRSAPRGR